MQTEDQKVDSTRLLIQSNNSGPVPPATAKPHGALDWMLSSLVSLLPFLSFCFMAYSAINTLYKSKGDPTTFWFVGSSFSLLGLLYLCMWIFEKTRDVPSSKRNLQLPLKIAIWLLSVALTMLFSYRVSSVLDSLFLAGFVWTVAVLTSGCGFCFLFLLN